MIRIISFQFFLLYKLAKKISPISMPNTIFTLTHYVRIFNFWGLAAPTTLAP